MKKNEDINLKMISAHVSIVWCPLNKIFDRIEHNKQTVSMYIFCQLEKKCFQLESVI